MRKRLIGMNQHAISPGTDVAWLSLSDIASVEISSESDSHSIEAALVPGGAGWRAAEPGRQVIRVCFDQPQQLSRIGLEFNEPGRARTQEYALRWSDDHGSSFHEIVRQQWNFSAPESAREIEEHHVDLRGVTVVELQVTPDISGGDACASLTYMRLA